MDSRPLLAKIRDLCGEHCDGFVFIGRVEDGDGHRTISTWDGEINQAVGLTERMKERLRHDFNETDYPPDAIEGDDWKAEV